MLLPLPISHTKRPSPRPPGCFGSILPLEGCDGLMFLDDTPTMLREKLSLSKINSLRSYEVVDEIKEALEKACPQTVSRADIIIMASRDAV